MRFDESHEGDYRIFVGAVEAASGDGYTAALIVNRVRGMEPHLGSGKTSTQREAFRDDSLACGYRWRSAEEAIHYAMNRARELIRSRSQMLAC
jgi:hypothetical protein